MGRGFEPHRAHLLRKARTCTVVCSSVEVRAFLMPGAAQSRALTSAGSAWPAGARQT